MEYFKNLLKSPAFALGLTPLIFAFSQVVVLGYNWIYQGYAGNLSLTVSRYVGLNLWTSILFAICNILIIALMFRYYLSVRKSRSALWFIFACFQSLGFLILSLCPHNVFIEDQAVRSIINNIHTTSARIMFVAMFGMAIETLRLFHRNRLKPLQHLPLLKPTKRPIFPKITTRTCIFFILYGLFYLIVVLTSWRAILDQVLILETGYIYTFMAFLILTYFVRPSDASAS